VRRFLRGVVFAIVAAGLQAGCLLSSWNETVETAAVDLWFRMRGPIEPPKDVVVVALDDESYGVMGYSPNMPWPRATHAALLERLARAGVQRVVFDVLFLGTSSDPAADVALAKGLAGVPSVIGVDVEVIEDAGSRREQLLTPPETLQGRAVQALVGLPEDAGRLRRFLVQKPAMAPDIPSLAEAGAAVRVGSVPLPGPRDFINFYGPARSIRTIEYYQVMDDAHPLPEEMLRGKIVFVGLLLGSDVGPARKDAYVTPFSERGPTFGVEVHATATANLLNASWIGRAPLLLENLGLIAVASRLGALMVRFAVIDGILVVGGIGLAWAVAAFGFFRIGWLLPGAALTTTVLPSVYLLRVLFDRAAGSLRTYRTRGRFDVFLSYRRDGSAAEARVIRSELDRVHGLRVFLDVEDLGAGRFDSALQQRIEQTPNFIVVLAPGSLERCAAPEDVFRQEIAHALKTARNVVPVLLPGFEFPAADRLPAELQDLRVLECIRYSHEHFSGMLARLHGLLLRSKAGPVPASMVK
jgi:CHASE2 domain-containing sensor protein